MPTGIYERTPEHCAKTSATLIGVPHSPKHNAAIREAMRNSPAVKAANEAKRGVPKSPEHIMAIKKGREDSGASDTMRGGNDIVDHHYIYDDDDLSKYTTKMTRSRHTRLHNNMRKSGIEIPHINME